MRVFISDCSCALKTPTSDCATLTFCACASCTHCIALRLSSCACVSSECNRCIFAVFVCTTLRCDASIMRTSCHIKLDATASSFAWVSYDVCVTTYCLSSSAFVHSLLWPAGRVVGLLALSIARVQQIAMLRQAMHLNRQSPLIAATVMLQWKGQRPSFYTHQALSSFAFPTQKTRCWAIYVRSAR